MEDARLLHEVPHAADTNMHRSLLSRIQDLTLHEVHAAMSRSLKHPYSQVQLQLCIPVSCKLPYTQGSPGTDALSALFLDLQKQELIFVPDKVKSSKQDRQPSFHLLLPAVLSHH